MRFVFALLAMILLQACAINPVQLTSICGFKRSVIDISMPSSSAETVNASAPRRSEDSVLDALKLSGTVPASSDGRPIDPSMLFLSGGSQHGAFGAGFLSGLKKREGNLPKFAVVTGVSTGSILSTFAFVDRPELMADAYSIHSESQLLAPLVSVTNGAPTTFGYFGLVKKGAIADLAPLREFLHRALTDDILARVAQGQREGRILRVGVVDVDTGEAVAIDLADMARQWANAVEARKPALKDCYVEAIVASSSAPLAARPVFIDNRMYIDGGARFGAFANEFTNVVALARAPENFVGGRPLSPTIYLLINGDQHTDSRCGRADEAFCDPPRSAQNQGKPLGDPAEPQPVSTHRKWSFLKLALRSEGILIPECGEADSG